MSSKVKILLDSDVVIHFIKGGCLSLLPRILPAYRFVILDLVLNEELRKNSETRRQIDNHLHFIKNIEVIAWAPDYEMMAEYGRLIHTLGIGESASMVYCKYHSDVLASSNLRDIKDYCVLNRITWLSTMDFLFLAHHRHVMSEQECDEFITTVLQQGSKLPVTKLSLYTPRQEVLVL